MGQRQEVESYSIQVQEAKPDMSIVLVCWNNKDYLEPCLDSLYQGDLKSSFDVIVVDNGSTDGSQKMLAENFPQVGLIQNVGNEGLGKASNQGIEATNGRHVLLLNNDTIVNGPSLDAMVEFMEATPSAGAVGGRLLNDDGSDQSCYNNFSTLREEFLIATRLGELLWEGYPGIVNDHQTKQVDWMTSACLLLRREALDQVGLLDEEYFIYGDETDIQFRLQQAGWLAYYLPNASTIHYGGRSMNRWSRRKMVYRGQLLFYNKNYGSFRTTILRLMLGGLSLLKLLPWGVAHLIPGQRDRAQKEAQSNIDVIRLCIKLE